MPSKLSPRTPVERFHEAALLGMLASGFFAMVPSLDWITVGATLSALLLRALVLFGWVRFAFPPRLVPWLGLAGALFYLADTLLLSRSFVAATMHLVCYLASVKMLSAQTRRDFAWIRVIALLEVLAASMASSGPTFFLFFCGFVLCAVATFASGEIIKAMGSVSAQRVARSIIPSVPRRLAGVSALLFSVTLLAATILFFVLPRTARAAFQRFGPLGQHLAGFAGEIRFGELGELKRNYMPVMHVRSFSGEPLPAMRWRGAALTLFDGKRWYNPTGDEEAIRVDRGVVALEARRRPGRELQYQVEVSPGVSDTLFFAGSPKTLTIESRALLRDSNGSVRVPRVPAVGLRYGVFAVLESPTVGDSGGEVLSEALRRRMVRTPMIDPRVVTLARRVTAGAQDTRSAALAIERHLKAEYSYTLELPQEEEADPIAAFLFSRKKGHCEYFASAMTVMLRSIGIPSRIATGFLNGVYNSVTGWQVIRASDAHSWVEVWVEGQGWVTFDPTPPDESAAAGELSGLPMFSDAVGQLWQEWVVGYDFQRQLAFVVNVEKAGQSLPTRWPDLRWPGRLQDISMRGVWLFCGLSTALVTWLNRKRLQSVVKIFLQSRRIRKGRIEAADVPEMYRALLQLLAERGITKPGWVTPAEFAVMLPKSEASELVGRATEVYHLSRFGGRKESALEMAEILARLRKMNEGLRA